MSTDKIITIAHIVNPCIVPETSDLYTAQPITFETMKIAKERANKNVRVELYSAVYIEDASVTPVGFKVAGYLEESCKDIVGIDTEKKLPLINEIIGLIYNSSEADYLIYTNVDIGLYQEFYNRVSDIIEQGYDAFTITRRTITQNYTSVKEIPDIFKEKGYPHLGWDCFVFKRSLVEKLHLDNIFIGAPGVGRALLCNLIFLSTKFACFNDEIITFHIGDDGQWKKTEVLRRLNKLNDLNRVKTIKVINKLISMTDSKDRKNELIFHYYELLKGLYPRLNIPIRVWHKFIKIMNYINGGKL